MAIHSHDSYLETQLPSVPVRGEEYLLLQTTSLGHLWDAGNSPRMGWEAAEPQQEKAQTGARQHSTKPLTRHSCCLCTEHKEQRCKTEITLSREILIPTLKETQGLGN